MPRDVLYEIGVEEIPASFVLPALKQLEEGLREGLKGLRLEFGDTATYGTPRRFAIIVKGVADRQPDIEQEYKGPPAERAFDEDGKPTKAAEGFARTRGVSVGDLEVRETDKGSWVFAKVAEPGQVAEEVLPGLLTEVTLSLTFPKTMRWADLDVRFARPIRWLVALLGDEVLNLTVADVRAGNTTRGHRFLGAAEVPLSGADEYLETLRGSYVLADHEERREAVGEAAEAAAVEVGGRARIDEGLLTEVSFLLEWPTCLAGRFDEQYLALPEPVIVTVMQGHQKYFPVEDEDGKLMPYFIAIRDGGDEGLEIVRAGNEKVIVPRLDDAEFYLTEDLKHSLEQRVESLARVTFMEGLGTLADKTQRLERLVIHLATSLAGSCSESRLARPFDFAQDRQESWAYDWEAVGQVAKRAAHLSKADLVTLMVGDSKLGELQGIVGGEYAVRLGEDDAVAAAIAEQYRPRGAGDAVPETPAGTLLSIADKMDNLAACFRLGAIPTGSTDPFALRRQAQGIVEVLLAKKLRVNLRALMDLALELLPEPQLEREKDAAKVLAPDAAAAALVDFFGQRVGAALDRDGVSYDVARAVLAVPWDDPVAVYERACFLQQLRDDDEAAFDTLVTAAERPARIVRPEDLADDAQADVSLFSEEWETRLHDLSGAVADEVCRALAETPRDYAAATQALAALAEPIHEFFEEVMVMVEDEAVRNNRLAMLQEIDGLFLQVADFLEIVREGE